MLGFAKKEKVLLTDNRLRLGLRFYVLYKTGRDIQINFDLGLLVVYYIN